MQAYSTWMSYCESLLECLPSRSLEDPVGSPLIGGPVPYALSPLHPFSRLVVIRGVKISP